MPEPTEDKWLDISNKFWSKTNFPNCVGSVDGKHVRCINTVVADSNLRFVAIDVGAYGKEGDCTVFRDSPIGKKLRDGIHYDDTETHPFMDVNNLGRGKRGEGLHIRDNFANYFMGTGAIPFQRNYMYLATDVLVLVMAYPECTLKIYRRRTWQKLTAAPVLPHSMTTHIQLHVLSLGSDCPLIPPRRSTMRQRPVCEATPHNCNTSQQCVVPIPSNRSVFAAAAETHSTNKPTISGTARVWTANHAFLRSPLQIVPAINDCERCRYFSRPLSSTITLIQCETCRPHTHTHTTNRGLVSWGAIFDHKVFAVTLNTFSSAFPVSNSINRVNVTPVLYTHSAAIQNLFPQTGAASDESNSRATTLHTLDRVPSAGSGHFLIVDGEETFAKPRRRSFPKSVIVENTEIVRISYVRRSVPLLVFTESDFLYGLTGKLFVITDLKSQFPNCYIAAELAFWSDRSPHTSAGWVRYSLESGCLPDFLKWLTHRRDSHYMKQKHICYDRAVSHAALVAQGWSGRLVLGGSGVRALVPVRLISSSYVAYKCTVTLSSGRSDFSSSNVNDTLRHRITHALIDGKCIDKAVNERGAAVRLLASDPGETCSIPGGVAPEFSHVGIVQDDAAGRWVFSVIFPVPCSCTPALLHTHLVSPSSALKTSMLRAIRRGWARNPQSRSVGFALKRTHGDFPSAGKGNCRRGKFPGLRDRVVTNF
ncbi:hypothetical protein PR048_028507 [Dryococelus australis]|uniref:DDE Tnp4 domain-containing protein n=1 Tax=Dryococelus australis TaxID=614101 RepID=A0ABQ9GDB6_9NEOP|nr:hypothetical protein PR048_028507 [Dryococelus australis]